MAQARYFMGKETAGMSFKVHWSRVICKQPGNYLGWPTIGRTAAGELLVVFSGDRETHVCPYGKNQMIRSRDGGKTWSETETINNSPLDDRDTGIVVMRSGAILITWFTGTSYSDPDRYRERYPDSYDAWVRHWQKIPPEDRERYHGNWSRRSTDGGRTWEPAVSTVVTAPHGPIQLRDGRLLMVGNTSIDDMPVVAAAESADEGRSWSMAGVVPFPEGKAADAQYFNEPHLVELPDGKVVCLIRYDPNKERSRRAVHAPDGECRRWKDLDHGVPDTYLGLASAPRSTRQRPAAGHIRPPQAGLWREGLPEPRRRRDMGHRERDGTARRRPQR